MSKTNLAFFLPLLRGGGAERVVVNLANALAERDDLNVYLFLCKTGGHYEKIISPKVRVESLGEGGTALAVFPLVRQLRKRSISVCIGAMPTANSIACLAKRFVPGLRVILTEHNDIRPQLALGSQRWTKKYTPVLIRHLYAQSDRIVCVSRGVGEFVASVSNRLQPKIRVIHNPVYSPSIKTLAAEPLHEPVFGEAEIKLMTAGRLTQQKNIALFVRAVALLVERGLKVRACILGEGPELPALQALVEQLRLTEQVRFLGFQDNPYKYMAQADVFVMSSIWEGFGNVLVEAAACGARIVTTDCPSGPREIVEFLSYGTLVTDFEQQSLADAIVSEAAATSQLNPATLDAFAIEHVSTQYYNLVQEILHEVAR